MNPLLMAALKTALAGGATGALYGGMGKVLSGGRSIADTLKAAAVGGGLGATAVGASTLAGAALKGMPEEDEKNAWMKRGGLGGAALGLLGGSALGGLAAAGKLPKISPKMSEFLTKNLPLKNIITDKITSLSKNPSPLKTALGAGIGGLTLGTVAGATSADEGQMYDSIDSEIESAQKRRMLDKFRGLYDG